MLCLLAACASLPGRAADAKLDPSGAWTWNAANPDGQMPDITVNLKLQGEALTGTIVKSTGTVAITNGTFKGDEVSFQQVRLGRNGKSTTTFTGTLSGDTIKGKAEIETGTNHVASDWGLKRVGAKRNAGTNAR
jgi:hypothetical protein